MNNKKKINTLLAGAVAALSFGAVGNAAAVDVDKEKCYGVVKAGKNDCGSADKSHSCASQATADASGQEWIALPKGLCEKLAGGSLEPVAAGAEAAPAGEKKAE